MRHEGSPHIALSSTLGKAAKLTVDEHNGTVFAKWKPHSLSAVPSPSVFNGDPVPLQPSPPDAMYGATT